MSRRRTACVDPQAESFMKTLKAEHACLTDCGRFEDVAAGLPSLIGVRNRRRLHSAFGHPGPVPFEDRHARVPVKTAA